MAVNILTFNGTTQYAKIDNFSLLNALTNFTVEFYVKANAGSAAYDPFFNIANGSTNFARFSTENGTGNQGFNFATVYAGTDADGYESDSRITNGTLLHVAFVHDATLKKTSIFVNGVENSLYNLQQTGTSTLQDSTGMALFLAAWGDLSAYSPIAVGGFLRVWNRALTGAEIYYNRNLILTPANETGLIVNCGFSEGSGTVVDNDATAGEDLDLYNTPTWGTDSGVTLTAKSYTNTYLFRQIAASTDDAEEVRSSTVMSLTSGDYEVPADGGVPQHFGLRFLNLTIPSGATIQSAYVRFAPNENVSAGSVNIDVYGNDVDDAGTFTSTNADISGRTRTTATVVYPVSASNQNTIYSTPDLKTILQEIIDRGGWASGNDVALVFIAPNDTTKKSVFHSYNGQPYSSAMLHVEYTVGGSAIKTVLGLAKASVKTINGLAIASVKTRNGLT